MPSPANSGGSGQRIPSLSGSPGHMKLDDGECYADRGSPTMLGSTIG